MLKEAESQVPIEDVMKLLRDDKGRNFTFEIESSSTILTDELQEKQSRNEFMQAFTNASQAMMGMEVMGEQGAKPAGSVRSEEHSGGNEGVRKGRWGWVACS